MALVAASLYAMIALLVWRLSKEWIQKDFLVPAAVFWPVTLLVWLLAGMLLLPALLLALAGYLNTSWSERRPRRFSRTYSLL